MARNVTLLQLRTRVRQRADIESATSRHTDVEVNDHLNEAIAELNDVMRSAFDQNFFRSSTTFLTTGARTYSLPSDFLSMISVDIYSGSGTNNVRYSATKFQESQRNTYQAAFAGYFAYGQPVMCRLYGNNIDFVPTPNTGTLIGLNYVPTTLKLVLDSDTLDGVNGWEEYVILDAAIKCLIKDDGFEKVGVLEGRKSACMKRITDIMSERDSGQAERVNDVMGYTTGSGYPGGYSSRW